MLELKLGEGLFGTVVVKSSISGNIGIAFFKIDGHEHSTGEDLSNCKMCKEASLDPFLVISFKTLSMAKQFMQTMECVVANFECIDEPTV